jgi:glycosyltransferase involved in cell wall biosynthesis
MNVCWFSWKDLDHPLAGGAEVVTHGLARRLVAEGHHVELIVGGFANGAPNAVRDGVKITRLGNRYTLYWSAYRYYKKHLQAQLACQTAIVIDEMNTVPFFCHWYVKQPSLLFVHMLCRQIWWHELPPFIGWVGYLTEPIYLWMLQKSTVMTVSNSTKNDLVRFGFLASRCHIIPESTTLDPIADLANIKKFPQPTILSLGSIRSMKQTHHIIQAFELAKAQIPQLQLVVAGMPQGAYGRRVLAQIATSPYAASITYHGAVTRSEKIRLMQQAQILCVASVKEGWGLVVTEANSQGTPSVVYDVDGLRDSVRNNETGLVTTQNTPQSLSLALVKLLRNTAQLAQLRQNAWQWSKELTFERSYQAFIKVLHDAALIDRR